MVRGEEVLVKQRLPDFLVIGAAKCGTTSLASYLGAHESIYMARPKELRFFSHNWDHGLDWYATRFDRAPRDSLLGEASPQYTQAPFVVDVPERIASVIPGVRLVYLVRDPLDQMSSFYRHLRFKGLEKAPNLDVALKENPYYLAVASYGYQASLYLQRFNPDQLLIVDSAELLARRSDTLDTILDFLDIEGSIPELQLDIELNKGSDKDFLPGYLSYPRRLWRAWRKVTGRIPRTWRHSMRSVLVKPPPPDAFVVSSDTKQWLAAKLEPDLRDLARLANGTVDRGIPQWLEKLTAG